MASSLRPRTNVDYKLLHEGESFSLRESRVQSKLPIPDEHFYVERLIWRRKSESRPGFEYLVKWDGYHLSSSTWEPSTNLPAHVLSNFIPESINDSRLSEFSATVERAVSSRLKSRNPKSVRFVNFDVFRFVFGGETTVLCNRNDFDKLNLPDHWFYDIKKDGTGRKIKFPIKLSLHLCKRKMYVKVGGQLVLKETFMERCTMYACTEACSFQDL